MKKLIKLSSHHYVIVDNSEIKEGDWKLCLNDNSVYQYLSKKNIESDTICQDCKKITHSTQPLEYDEDNTYTYDKVNYIPLSYIKELIGEVDMDKKAEKYADFRNDYVPLACGEKFNIITKRDYLAGYSQSLEDNKEKKYTEEDLRKAIEMAREQTWYEGNGGFVTQGYWKFVLEYAEDIENMIQSLQPKTDWEVEFVDGKLKLK